MNIMKKLFTARGIQIVLAILWFIDGLFQLQPQMFTSNFAQQVIAPAADGQPWFVSNLMNFSIHIIQQNTVLFGIAFAVIQLAIGVLIFLKPTVKIGLIASIVWGLGVWYVGEGAGGIFSGQTTLLMGAPGAALLYSILSFAVYPRKNKTDKQNRQPASWLLYVWAATWVGGAVFQLLPGQNTVNDLSSMILGNADGAPAWMASIDTHIASWITSMGLPVTSMQGMSMDMTQMAHMQTEPNSGLGFVVVISFIQFLIGVMVFTPRIVRRIVIAVGIALSFIFWVVGQSLGEYFSGLATDPSTAPLIILLGLAVLGGTGLDRMISKFYRLLKEEITGRNAEQKDVEVLGS
jgi:hypothetical protein